MNEFVIYLTEYYHYLIYRDAYMVTLVLELFMRVSYVYNGYDLERIIPIIQSTSGFLLQISLLCLPSSLTSHFYLSLLLPPMGSVIYALSALITKNDL